MAEETKGKYTFVDKRGQAEPARSEKPAEKPQPRQEPPKEPPACAPRPNMPIDFSTLIMSLATSAVMAMGKAPDPQTGQYCKDMVVAKQNIDIVSMLKDKTKGNRTREEDQLMEDILYELKLIYVEAQGGGK